MSAILAEITCLLPQGDEWYLSNLIFLTAESWQVNITNGEHVTVATGTNPEDAISNATLKAESGIFTGRLNSLERAYLEPAPSKLDLRSLGLAKPQPKIERRI